MGYRTIVTLVDYGKLTAEQRAKLKKLLQDRKAELEQALSEVEEGLNRLKPKGKKSSKRKAAKRGAAKRR